MMRRLAFDELEDQVSTDEFGSVSAHAFASHELKQKADLRLLDELKEEDTFQPYDRNRVFPQQITSSDDFKYSSGESGKTVSTVDYKTSRFIA